MAETVVKNPRLVYEFWLEMNGPTPRRRGDTKGCSYARLGRCCGVSRERVRQIIDRYKDGTDERA